MFYSGDFDEPASMFDAPGPILADLVVESLDVAASADLSNADEQRLCDAALRLEKLRRLLDATECHVLAELDSRDVTDRSFGLRTGSWLADRADLPPGVAKVRVRTAKTLANVLPDVDHALSAGTIGFDHAKVFVDLLNPRIADQLAAVSGELCDQASEMAFNPWRRQVQLLAELFDEDGSYDPDADLARNRLRLSTTGDNTAIKGELVGEQALIANEALNSIADELFQQFAKDREQCPDLKIPGRSTLLALALVEACRRGIASPVGSSKSPRPEASLILTPNSISQASPTERPGQILGGTGFKAPPGVRWSPIFDQGRQWTTGRGFAGMTVLDSHGHPLHQRSWRTLLCDPDMHATVINSLGVPLDMGKRIRFAGRQQRRALAVRDGGCVFPGCTAPPSWTDAHHVVHWEHGGSTDLANLVSLCRHHHGVAHRRGWKLDLDPEGWTSWTSPNGQTFQGQQHQQQRRPTQRRPPPVDG